MLRSRDEGISESSRLRDLGRYAEALALLHEVEAEHADLDLVLEICRLLSRMGLGDQACQKIAIALETYSNSENDSSVLIHAQFVHSSTVIMQTARPSEPMKVIVGIYNRHLKTRAFQDYTERMVDLPWVQGSDNWADPRAGLYGIFIRCRCQHPYTIGLCSTRITQDRLAKNPGFVFALHGPKVV